MDRPRFRILALDLDGTLLGPDGGVSLATRTAIDRVVEAGILPVLCTGRRPRGTVPVARTLKLQTPMVCNSGALIKTIDDQTLWRADWPRELFLDVIAVFRSRNEPAISFLDQAGGDSDFMVEVARTSRALFDDFVNQNQQFVEVAPNWAHDLAQRHYHLTAIGSRESMLDLERALLEALEGRVQTFVQKSPRYAGTMCEVLRVDANKWRAILELCTLWGIDPAEVCAVGDDMNDVPMIRGAGLGVAMGHAPDLVKAKADLIMSDVDDDGVARLINEVLLP